RSVQLRVGGKRAAAGEHVVTAIDLADIAPGFAHEDDAGGDVPGRQVVLPEAFVAARGDIGEVEGGAAEAADAGDGRERRIDLRDKNRALAIVDAAARRDPRRKEGLVELAPRRYAQAPVVQIGPDALFGPEQFVLDRIIDDAGNDIALALEPDRDGEVRNAM